MPLLAPPASARPRAQEPERVIELWPHGIPDLNSGILTEQITDDGSTSGIPNRAINGISNPRMAVFPARQPNGPALLIMPGGGYGRVMIDHEGYDLARYVIGRGITAFVLFYRLPAEGWASGPEAPTSDAQRAMRLIRHYARDYRIDPARVGAIGYSAGGHLCATLATGFARRTYPGTDPIDMLSPRPDYVGLIYPVISMQAPLAHSGSRERLISSNPSQENEHAHSPHLNVPDDAPPHFLVHAEDDMLVPVGNTLAMRTALIAKHVPVETHLFPNGGHGFGLRKVNGSIVGNWPELMLTFLKAQTGT